MLWLNAGYSEQLQILIAPPLSGATVVVKELSDLGAVANVDGHYELRLPDNKNYTIIATYIGYIDESKNINEVHNGTLNFQLTENNTILDQVVVTVCTRNYSKTHLSSHG